MNVKGLESLNHEFYFGKMKLSLKTYIWSCFFLKNRLNLFSSFLSLCRCIFCSEHRKAILSRVSGEDVNSSTPSLTWHMASRYSPLSDWTFLSWVSSRRRTPAVLHMAGGWVHQGWGTSSLWCLITSMTSRAVDPTSPAYKSHKLRVLMVFPQTGLENRLLAPLPNPAFPYDAAFSSVVSSVVPQGTVSALQMFDEPVKSTEQNAMQNQSDKWPP